MAIYAIGDIQGCYDVLMRLLKRVGFDSAQDTLWLVGDLINRGPQSLEVLRYVKSLGDKAVTVLGNHELHMLGIYLGIRAFKKFDTCQDILNAADVDDLIQWLRTRPIVVRDDIYLLVHAGFLPQWSVKDIEYLARGCEQQLQSKNWQEFLRRYFDAGKMQWHEASDELTQFVIALQMFTRLRVCNAAGVANLNFTGKPEDCPSDMQPWFKLANRQTQSQTAVFGHWAALGLYIEPQVIALDSGCVWGNCLTAMRLEDREIFQESA